MIKTLQLILLATGFILVSCNDNSKTTSSKKPIKKNESKTLFTKLSNSKIEFRNDIKEDETLNYFIYEYAYSGGGVGIGDFNNDGLKDVYFVSNQNKDEIYINKGDLKFEKLKQNLNQSEDGWHTGVAIVDLNADGFDDIYVCRSGYKTGKGNLFYLNQKNGSFKECANEIGIANNGYSTQANFFDFDNDGDLDLYVLNHPLNTAESKSLSVGDINDLLKNGKANSDALYQNNNGVFEEVTKHAGVYNHAFGLGLSVSDINNDGWADLYIANDYMAPDYIYINQKNGTFKDEALLRTKHISNNSMGVDIADFNNDNLNDIVTLDMASEDHVRSKKNMGAMSAINFWNTVKVGYNYQYMFNALQMNTGKGKFSDIAQMAGVAKTDWSWAPLLADFDNDGFKDLFVTNGFYRDARDNDFVRKLNSIPKDEKLKMTLEEKLAMMPKTKLSNYCYQNQGDLTFQNKAAEWGVGEKINSQGAVYSDLDNDGDLDLILNNINEIASVYRNNSEVKENNWLSVNLVGIASNLKALGAKVYVMAGKDTYYQEKYVVRGFMSSVDERLNFGLGKNKKVNIKIIWPDLLETNLSDVNANQHLTIKYDESEKTTAKNKIEEHQFFETVKPNSVGLDYVNDEILFNDFKKEVLLPHKMSQLGPFTSVADVNGDGLTDVFIGGSRKMESQLYTQNTNGQFVRKKCRAFSLDKACEDMSSVFFDADKDGDLDLYVVSGGNEKDYRDQTYQDRLYLNDGKGNFTKASDALPPMVSSGQVVIAEDYDKDGDIDLFVGGRQTPQFYPFAPRSFLLENENGVFKDVTSLKGKELMGPGLITDAKFGDLDKDGDIDLVVVGEWMNIQVYENRDGYFRDISRNIGLTKTVGWWRSVSLADVNNDGEIDLICGNIGKNNKYHPNKNNPLHIYTHDFDKTGTYDIVLAKNQNNICYPVRGRQCTSEQMPEVAAKFPTYGEFASADIKQLYSKEQLDQSLHFEATMFQSVVLLNKGGFQFEILDLPNEAQIAPLNALQVIDLNKDGNLDLVGVGNYYQTEVETTRYDAGVGSVLLGNGDGSFKAISNTLSGFRADLDARDLDLIHTSNGTYYVVTNNTGPLQIFKRK